MNTISHPIAPEEVMAFLDGELSNAEAAAVSEHLEDCADCRALREQLNTTSQALANWKVPATQHTLNKVIKSQLATFKRNQKPQRTSSGFNLRNWRVWTLAGGSAVFGVLALVIFVASVNYREEHVTEKRKFEQAELAMPEPEAPMQEARVNRAGGGGGGAQLSGIMSNTLTGESHAVNHSAPLIARTVSLKILVNELNTARPALDAILLRHQGYAAKLTVELANQPRGLTASLRIPIAEMSPAIAEMRALGKVQQESQTAEEVTAEHIDIAARLANARETETRLRDILANRTGKMEDVLEVEDKISETRGEIEGLEAEEKNLDHRIEFATVELELVEEYSARLDTHSDSLTNKIRNSFIAGLSHLGETLLGILLFFEEYAPVLILWLVLLGLPVLLIWRRYRKATKSTGQRL